MNTFAKIVDSFWWYGFWIVYSILWTALFASSAPAFIFGFVMCFLWGWLLGGKISRTQRKREAERYLRQRYITINNQENK